MPTPSTKVTPEPMKVHVTADVVPRKLSFAAAECEGQGYQTINCLPFYQNIWALYGFRERFFSPLY